MADETERPARAPTHPGLEVLKRHWAVRAALVLAPAIASAVAAYSSAAGEAHQQSAVVKDKAESGYQATIKAMKELQERVTQLDAEVAALKHAVRVGSKRLAARAAPVVEKPAPPPPPAMPPDLDKALQVQQAKAPPTPAEKPPAPTP